MSNPIYSTRFAETLGSDALAELALDLRWAFNHATDAIWQRLDPELWALTHNPWVVLQTASRARLEAVTADPAFQAIVDDLVRERRDSNVSPAWFHQTHPNSPLSAVAYFSMEFMLSEALPIYSGGLGNVAGDQLKTASTLGVPLVGVGLLYQQGYFRQEIDGRGRQRALYPFNDPGQLPIRPLRDADGEWVRLSVAFPGSALWIRVWEAQIGRTRLYLLDTNDPANRPAHRGITSELYGGDDELRLQQEIVLGIGGWRMLRALGSRPEVCHMNEGHAALAVLERARSHMADHRQPFDLALTATRCGNVFTTHTPVDAGFDRFDPQLLTTYLASYAMEDLGVPFDDVLALGRCDPHDSSEPFNMAYLAIHGSYAVNGVSRLHGAVSRHLFQPLFPRWPVVEVPVGHITNGVHVPTWDSVDADRLWETACGKNRWRGTMEDIGRNIRGASDDDLWGLRVAGRASLVGYVREQLARQLAERGVSAAGVKTTATILNPDALTIGFARRFALYKRPNLLLHDADRLAQVLTNGERPVQLVVAGKAHPEDLAGQALIEQWIAFVRRPDVRPHAVFLADYDMLMAEHLVQGVDLWINTPRRPWEACGTSGMKVLVNGGLNLSELDGWWAEAYTADVGWAIGDGQTRDDDPAWDAAEADAVYALLEREIVPTFYTRDARGVPLGWVARMRESMVRLTPAFAANRTVREYTETRYLPMAAAYRSRTADNARLAAELVAWRKDLDRGWSTAAFRSVEVRTEANRHVFSVALDLGSLSPAHVQVELYADGVNGGGAVRQPMNRGGRLPDVTNGFLYTARVCASRPPRDFTPRLVPFHAAAAVPLEAPLILWADGS
jgi:starch phosphorylase